MRLLLLYLQVLDWNPEETAGGGTTRRQPTRSPTRLKFEAFFRRRVHNSGGKTNTASSYDLQLLGRREGYLFKNVKMSVFVSGCVNDETAGETRRSVFVSVCSLSSSIDCRNSGHSEGPVGVSGHRSPSQRTERTIKTRFDI